VELIALTLTEYEPEEAEPGVTYLAGSPTGDFIVDGFPATIEIGLLLEIGFDEDEDGEFEVSLDLEIASDSGRTVLQTFPFVLPPCDASWWGVRLKRLVTSLSMVVEGELDSHLGVECNAAYLGGRAIRVRAAPVV
jgi:hypothetical protein